MSRRAGCGKPARPDPWGPREGNDPGLPDLSQFGRAKVLKVRRKSPFIQTRDIARVLMHDPNFDIQARVGRLVEVWAEGLSSAAELHAFARRFRAAMEAGPRRVVCADYRALDVVVPEVWRAWVQGMQQVNPQLERSALILPRHNLPLRTQVERALAEAAHSERRICLDAAEAKEWLWGRLDKAERKRLLEFLAERRLA